MARKFNLEEQPRRGDVFFFKPEDILVREVNRGRKYQPTPERVLARAESMMDYGQEQPVTCRIENGGPVLILGFTRSNAARLIRQGFTDSEGNFRQDPDFVLQSKIVQCDDKEAFVHNIVENAHRDETSPIDDAWNQERLRTQYGYNNAEIARVYRYNDVQKVYRNEKLLELPEELQQKVHFKQLTVNAAIDYLNAPVDQRDEILKQALKEDGSVDGSALRNAAREAILSGNILNDDDLDEIAEESDASSTQKRRNRSPKAPSRSMRDVRKFFEAMKESEDNDPALKDFAKSMLTWVKGKKTDKALNNAFNRLLAAREAEAAEAA